MSMKTMWRITLVGTVIACVLSSGAARAAVVDKILVAR